MTATEPPSDSSLLPQLFQFSPVLYFLLGIVAGAVIGVLVFSAIRGRDDREERQYWARLLGELGIGVLVASALHLRHHGAALPSLEDIATGLLHTLGVALVLELCHIPFALSKMENKLEELNELITEDQRTIFARAEPLERAREISFIGIERLPSGEIPLPLTRPERGGEWALTISLLRLDRLQDLLFSTEYLKHFLKLHDASKKQYRILVVNDKPRQGSEAAILSFLQMSETLGIGTYSYLKSEFYEMIKCLDKVKHAKPPARKLQEIMNGQPELSLMHDDSNEREPNEIKAGEDYKLRYRNENGVIDEFGPRDAAEMPIDRINWVHRLLHVAIHKGGDRRGLEGLPRVITGKICPNPWANCNERLDFPKKM
jgi:hypothetical protein